MGPRKSKYNRGGKAKIKPSETTTTTTTSTNMTTNNDNPKSEENNGESHEKFLNSAQESVKTNNKVTLEPTNQPLTNPHAQPKIHRVEALDGITNQPKEKIEQPKVTTSGPATATTENTPPPPPEVETDFNPTPPAEDDAPLGKGEETPETPIPEGEPFVIPTGSAEELIDWAADALNYLVDEHGDMVIGVKIHKDYYLVPKVIPLILAHNKSNNDRIKLKPAEVAMLKKPLIKLMQAKGVRDLTPGEELAAVAVIILVTKIKEGVKIRNGNKALTESFLYEVNKVRQDIARQNATTSTVSPSTTEKKVTLSDEEIPLSPTEEIPN